MIPEELKKAHLHDEEYLDSLDRTMPMIQVELQAIWLLKSSAK